ncbi:hypothetical protein T11_14474 [Trichinella zimbabwensis]|uniref:Uncharacterized protein n=1 Tax=Trichinella zimbabwensis TaxID=268475 RepID=A0A0V1H5U9_9BILA|nr:hypothetical protein T11_14474 [Trichinella zimbabwensis]
MNSTYELWRQISFFDHNDTSHLLLLQIIEGENCCSHFANCTLFNQRPLVDVKFQCSRNFKYTREY